MDGIFSETYALKPNAVKNVIWSYGSILTASVYNNDYVYTRAFIHRETLIRPHFFHQLSPIRTLPFTMSGSNLIVFCLGTLPGDFITLERCDKEEIIYFQLLNAQYMLIYISRIDIYGQFTEHLPISKIK